MRLPPFAYLEPRTLEEALDHLAAHGDRCRALAGGTDLLVRMKQRLVQPTHLMGLKRIEGLVGIRGDDTGVVMGTCTTLADILTSPLIRDRLPALYQATAAVGAVSIQHHTGTIGGNLCQDTRCLFYNQSAFWRSYRPPCHKAGGKTCYARKDSDRCHATFQSDIAPALMALDARVNVESRRGKREIPLDDLYSTIGDRPLTLAPDELLTGIRIPLPRPGAAGAYRRLSFRSAIDYPLVCAAVCLEAANGGITGARIVVGAVSRAPLLLVPVAESLAGCPLSDPGPFEAAAAKAMDLASAFIVDNVGASVDYRTRMVRTQVRQALEASIQELSARQRRPSP